MLIVDGYVTNVDEILALHKPIVRTSWQRSSGLLKELDKRWRGTALRDPAKELAVNPCEVTEARLTQPHSLFEHRVEDRREVAGRRVDDPQDLGGCGLLVESLARLGDQPRVLDRDDGLGREILHQRDLLVRERPDLLAVYDE